MRWTSLTCVSLTLVLVQGQISPVHLGCGPQFELLGTDQLYLGDDVRLYYDQCVSTCRDTYGSLYAFPHTLLDGNQYIRLCACGNNPPALSQYTPGPAYSSSNEECPYDTSSVVITKSTFSDVGCFVSVSPSLTSQAQTSVERCFQSCVGSTYAIVATPESTDTSACFCTDSSGDYSSPADCFDPPYLVYTHPKGTSGAPSAWAKRRVKGMSQQGEDQTPGYCPAGLTACNIVGSEEGFECINIADELESCGGCVNGLFGSSDGVSGTDCTAIIGAAPGGVACHESRCIVFDCDEGYTLSNEACLLKR
ncbi:hypothetical protein IAU60_002038 [Kwoniella sp. DSM 27419]